MKKEWKIGIGVVFIIVAILVLTPFVANQIERRDSGIITSTNAVHIDFSKAYTSMDMVYCIQEEGSPDRWGNSEMIQQFHQDVVGEEGYERIWVRRSYESAGLMDNPPLQDDCLTYDYTKLETLVRATLNKNMIPYISFGNSPWCFIQDKTPRNSNISAVNPIMPDDLNLMAEYEARVVEYFYNLCRNNMIRNCGNFEDWRFEIGNEPYQMAKPPSTRYAEWFHLSYEAIKEKVPIAQVGTGGIVGGADTRGRLEIVRDYANNKPDFLAIHFYDNAQEADSDFSQYRGFTYDQFILHDTSRGKYSGLYGNYYLRVNDFMDIAMDIFPDTLVYNFEYGISATYRNKDGDNQYVKYTQTEHASSWWVGAMYWMLQTDIAGECWYHGTDGNTMPSMGLWFADGRVKHSYGTRNSFVNLFKKGDKLWFSNNGEEVVAIANEDGMVISNTVNATKTVMISFREHPKDRITQNFNIIMEPYEVYFHRW